MNIRAVDVGDYFGYILRNGSLDVIRKTLVHDEIISQVSLRAVEETRREAPSFTRYFQYLFRVSYV